MASLLILTQPIQKIITQLPKVLKAASNHVTTKRLYIHLDYLTMNQTLKQFRSYGYRSYIISTIYSVSPSFCPGIDIRILMNGFKEKDLPIETNQNVEKIYIDYLSSPSDFMLLEKKYEGILNVNNSLILLDKEDAEEKVLDIVIEEGEDKVYDDVVAGGTFDRVHPGHKILLSEAVLRSRKRLTIGVADGSLLKRKVLKELILPCPERILRLREFLSDIDRGLEYNLVTIEEPMGPTSYDPKMEMIIVSDETKKGVQMINDYRKDKGLNELENYCIKVFDDSQKQFIEEEDKFSSSSQRMRLLGTRIRKVTPNLSIPDVPYVIGLTGGSASGKTNIGRVLKEMGAAVIDCDKLGHKAYEYGTKCYENLVEVFGGEIVNEDNTINRKVLGSMVFNSKDKLKQLTDIVWPQIALLAKKEMKVQFESGKKVMVLDAAVLLEAEWDQFCHEVWVATIDQEEAIRRIVERDQSTEEAASKRIKSQMTNEERVASANVVFCSRWSYEYTRKQVQSAWNLLQKEAKL